jgi:hypothetical protein
VKVLSMVYMALTEAEFVRSLCLETATNTWIREDEEHDNSCT